MENGTPLQIVFGVFDQPCVATWELGTWTELTEISTGDHDGDGDDELAVIQNGEVVIVDGEPI